MLNFAGINMKIFGLFWWPGGEQHYIRGSTRGGVVFVPSGGGGSSPPLSHPYAHVRSTAYDATHLESSVSKQRPRGFSPAVVTDDSENCFLL